MIGTRWSVRAALVVGALLIAPALVLFARALRYGGREPGLEGAATGAVPTRPDAC